MSRSAIKRETLTDYLGHKNPEMVRHYARTDITQLARTVKRADERSRVVHGLIDLRAAREMRPNTFFFLGNGDDGKPRYCGNPTWASCAHRLACQKCAMYVGGTAAELLRARNEVMHFQSTVPMNPEEQAASEGDIARLNERLAEIEGAPVPAVPGEAFVFNSAAVTGAIAPLPPVEEADPRAALTARLAKLEAELAEAEATGSKRNILARGLRNQIAHAKEQLAALGDENLRGQDGSKTASG